MAKTVKQAVYSIQPDMVPAVRSKVLAVCDIMGTDVASQHTRNLLLAVVGRLDKRLNEIEQIEYGCLLDAAGSPILDDSFSGLVFDEVPTDSDLRVLL